MEKIPLGIRRSRLRHCPMFDGECLGADCMWWAEDAAMCGICAIGMQIANYMEDISSILRRREERER